MTFALSNIEEYPPPGIDEGMKWIIAPLLVAVANRSKVVRFFLKGTFRGGFWWKLEYEPDGVRKEMKPFPGYVRVGSKLRRFVNQVPTTGTEKKRGTCLLKIKGEPVEVSIPTSAAMFGFWLFGRVHMSLRYESAATIAANEIQERFLSLHAASLKSNQD